MTLGAVGFAILLALYAFGLFQGVTHFPWIALGLLVLIGAISEAERTKKKGR